MIGVLAIFLRAYSLGSGHIPGLSSSKRDADYA